MNMLTKGKNCLNEPVPKTKKLSEMNPSPKGRNNEKQGEYL